MNLRYPLWHTDHAELDGVTMTQLCRAAIWYARNVFIKNSKLHGIKAWRECEAVEAIDCDIRSPEFGWKSGNITLRGGCVESEYGFFMARDLKLDGVSFRGKYSFQYVERAVIENCTLETKDAFWHSKDVTVKNCIVRGEYLGWYSENLTLINCKIIGAQPLCYCKGLKLIDCETENADLAFEYSEADVTVRGEILSIKNPKSGRIVADRILEVIFTEDSKYPCRCEVCERNARNFKYCV